MKKWGGVEIINEREEEGEGGRERRELDDGQ